MAKKFITKVIKDDSGDLSFIFPEDLWKELDLHIGEVLVWEVTDENSIVLRKANLIDTTTQKE